MSKIYQQIKLQVEDPSLAISRAEEYFLRSSFKIEEKKNNYIKIKRGSLFLNMLTFNPLKWKSNIVLRIEDNGLTADFEVVTVGQMPTHSEEKAWIDFIDHFKQHIETGDFSFIEANRNSIRTVRKDSLRYVGWAFLGGLLGGLPSGIIGHMIGVDNLVIIGSAGGALAYMSYKIQAEKDRKAPK